MASNKKIPLILIGIALFFGFCVFQNFANKEKHERRRIRKSNKVPKTCFKEYINKNFETLSVIGETKLSMVTVTKSANITGSTSILNSTVNHLNLIGLLNAHNSTIFEAKITGTVLIKECKIKDDFFVTGSFDAFDSSFEKVTVVGPVLCNNSIMSQLLKITGLLEARNSTLSDIDITTSDSIIFENCNVKKLLIRENKSAWRLFDSQISWNNKAVEVYLKGKSSISTIEFEPSVKGIVILENGSSVTSVKNGTIKRTK